MYLPRYAVPLDRPVLYRWVPGGTDTVDHVRVLGHQGGVIGCWNEVVLDDSGSDLTDADIDIAVSGNGWRRLVDGTLNHDRAATLLPDGASAGNSIDFTLLDTGFAYTIVNGGDGGGVILTKPSGQAWTVRVQFNGTDWLLRLAGQLP
jgi:hypothetical protein